MTTQPGKACWYVCVCGKLMCLITLVCFILLFMFWLY